MNGINLQTAYEASMRLAQLSGLIAFGYYERRPAIFWTAPVEAGAAR